MWCLIELGMEPDERHMDELAVRAEQLPSPSEWVARSKAVEGHVGSILWNFTSLAAPGLLCEQLGLHTKALEYLQVSCAVCC